MSYWRVVGGVLLGIFLVVESLGNLGVGAFSVLLSSDVGLELCSGWDTNI